MTNFQLTKKKKSLLLATRGSPLALTQSEMVQKKLNTIELSSELKIVKTTGDEVQDRPLSEIGGKGLFIKELEASLLRKETDFAVHSLKDLPCRLLAEFELITYLERDFPLDVIIFRKEDDFLKTTQSLVGENEIKNLEPFTLATGSLRRKALIQRTNPSLTIQGIRGNIGTRLLKLSQKNCDALILSEASIRRMPFDNEKFISYQLDPNWFVPSAGQGVIVVEGLKENSKNHLLTQLNCEKTKTCCLIERGVLEALGGSCLLPIGVFASFHENTLHVNVFVSNEDGSLEVRHKSIFPLKFSKKEILFEIKKSLYHKDVNKILNSLGLSSITL